MIMIETKWENMVIFLVEYLHLTIKVPIIPLKTIFMQERRTQMIILLIPEEQKLAGCI